MLVEKVILIVNCLDFTLFFVEKNTKIIWNLMKIKEYAILSDKNKILF